MTGAGRPDVGVVGDSPAVTDAVEAAGGTVHADPLGSPDTVDALVAVGESALCALVAGGPPDVPVLAIGAVAGVPSVSEDDAAAAVDDLVGGNCDTESHPVLGVAVGDAEPTRVLFDAMLVTVEPARISEFAVERGGDRVSQFRADGVVVATPAGSHGYASAVGAPVAMSDTDVVVAAPVAPFQTDVDRWVVQEEALTLSVEREESAVELLADDRTVGPVSPGTAVDVGVVDRLDLLVVPERSER
ncbi:MAG: ATP-NAD kinase [Halorientalis sp.]